MTFFSRLATTALAATVVFGAATAAYAHHPHRQPYVAAETKSLLQAARTTGITLFTDETGNARRVCQREGLLGAANTSSQLLICVKNHQGDTAEMADTIRHELVHSAQFCKGRKVGATSALLYPEQSAKMLKFARQFLHMPMDKYEPSKYASEAEARVLAHLLDEHQIASLLKEHCK